MKNIAALVVLLGCLPSALRAQIPVRPDCSASDIQMGVCRRGAREELHPVRVESVFVRVDTVYVQGTRPSAPAGAPQAQPAPTPVMVMNGRPEGWKDGGTATILSLLIPGAGQMYAGEVGTGVLMLLTSSAALGVAISQYGSCYDDCGGAAAAAGVALTINLISPIDAGSAASRHNKRLLKQRQVGLAPILTPTARGVNLGLSIRR
jgi:TM2 domain-containing membrane protein YozV